MKRKWVCCTVPEKPPVVDFVAMDGQRALVYVSVPSGAGTVKLYYGQSVKDTQCLTVEATSDHVEVCVDGLEWGKPYYFAAG